MEGMIEAVKRTPKLEGVHEIRIPGEVEHALAERRRAEGAVPLHPTILDGYRAAAEELGVPLDLVEAHEGAGL
jgi:LDH2 family malate/lactate/ureidoglycolate dehydrogenase